MLREEVSDISPCERADKAPWIPYQEGIKDKYSVEYADPEEIMERSEMRNSLFYRRIIHLDRNIFDIDTSPCRPYDDFHFELIPACKEVYPGHTGKVAGTSSTQAPSGTFLSPQGE